MFQPTPFATKELPDGKKLYRRKHGYSFQLPTEVSTYSITVPYSRAKINDAEFLEFPPGVTVNMKVKDTAQGTYSGTPNLVLNQYGFSCAIGRDFYKDVSPYDADVYQGMVLEFEFNNPNIAIDVALNMTFHEVV